MAVFTAKNRKGAFQLSLGFIITVVFAIVLLSLAIVWLQGLIGGIEDISNQLIQQAGVKLDETFQDSEVNFAIWPPDGPPYQVPVGTKMAVVAGIRNDAADSQAHTFGVLIERVSEPSGATTMPVLESVPPPKTVPFRGDPAKFPLLITIPEGATQGVYIYRITACSDADDYGSDCPDSITDAPELWGTAKDFVLEVTGR